MRTLFLLVMLFAGAAFAQTAQGGHAPGRGPTNRGHFLKPEQYATQAAVALFVDGALGSDSNLCTATGTSACATITGAMNKVPPMVQHPVVITVAAGTYTGFYETGRAFMPASSSGAYFSFVGDTPTVVTPTTGSATGTATGGTAFSGFTQGTLVDAAATWTVNDAQLIGAIVTITAGTGSGQSAVITSNTATSLTVAGAWTATTGTSTYTIRRPSVTINVNATTPANATSASNANGSLVNVSNTRAYRTTNYRFQDFAFAEGTSNVAALQMHGGGLSLVRCTISAIGLVAAIIVGDNGNVVLSDSFITNAGAATIDVGSQTTGPGQLSSTDSFHRNTGGEATVVRLINAFALTFNSNIVSTGNGYGLGSSGAQASPDHGGFGSAQSVQISANRFLCTTTTNTTGVYAASTNSVTAGYSVLALGATTANEVNGCGIGIEAAGVMAKVIMKTTTLTSNTIGIKARDGGDLFLIGVTTFTTNGTDIDVDGTTSTSAAFLALTPQTITNLNWGSSVGRQP